MERFFMWAQLGLNQRPPDYESGATNQLSYRPYLRLNKYICIAEGWLWHASSVKSVANLHIFFEYTKSTWKIIWTSAASVY